jgi:hypothetical protein
MVDSDESSHAEKVMRRVAGLLHSAVRVLERESSTPANELGMEHYMHCRYDPHPALKASLAGEPIPPAPDGDEQRLSRIKMQGPSFRGPVHSPGLAFSNSCRRRCNLARSFSASRTRSSAEAVSCPAALRNSRRSRACCKIEP